jgi:hypothetical protein
VLVSMISANPYNDEYEAEVQANANLIAAAPEMYDVLSRIVKHPNFSGCIDPTGAGGIDIRVLAAAALAKADGKQGV